MGSEDAHANAASYRAAGVDLEKADEAVRRIAARVASTYTSRVVTGVGPFASLFDLSGIEREMGPGPARRPALVSSTDGVGTKLLLHLEAGTYEEAGVDLVAMSSNDILTFGARPLFFLDYVACGKLDPEVVERFVAGMVDACRFIGAALIGGETAEMPGLYAPGEYDLSGFIVGVADLDAAPGPHRVRAGDALVGLASSGPHANGYSLVRRILRDAGIELGRVYSELGCAAGEALLAPTRLYHPAVMALLASELAPAVHAAANITGGGFFENVPRALPPGLSATIERGSYPVPRVFSFLQSAGSVPEREMYAVFNMGIGFVLVVDRDAAEDVRRRLEEAGERAFVIGSVRAVEGDESRVELR